MIQLHATKALAAKLPTQADGKLPLDTGCQWLENRHLPDNPLDHWQGHLFTLGRRQCVLLAHQRTRFPVFIPLLTKPDLARFHWFFVDGVMNTLLKCGASETQMETAYTFLAQLQVNSKTDRSVQGNMNQMKGGIEHLLWYDQIAITDLAPYQTSAWLANQLCSVKGNYFTPAEAMLDLLSTARPEAIAPSNVVQFDNRKRDASMPPKK